MRDGGWALFGLMATTLTTGMIAAHLAFGTVLELLVRAH